jgi:hypothetical protein
VTQSESWFESDLTDSHTRAHVSPGMTPHLTFLRHRHALLAPQGPSN